MNYDPALLLQAMSGLASSLSIASSLKNLMKVDTLTADQAWEELKNSASPELLLAMEDPLLESSAKEILIIDEKLLKQLTREAIRARDKHIKSRQTAASASAHQKQQLLDRASDEVVREMCSILREIKRFNGNDLPIQGQYRRWWASCSCAD